MNGLPELDAQPLLGVSVASTRSDPGVDVCLRHLSGLGAVLGDDVDGADVVITGPLESPTNAAIQCVLQEHRLLGGGLVASEATAQAALGITAYIGSRSDRPSRTGAPLASGIAGFMSAMGVMAMRYADPEMRHAARFGFSAMRALANVKSLTWAARSGPDDWAGSHVRCRDKQADSGYRTKDGRVTLDFPTTAEDGWVAFVKEIGLSPEDIDRLRPRWSATMGWGDDIDLARPLYEAATRRLTTEEAVETIRRNGGLSVSFQTWEECARHPQSRALGLAESVARGVPWRITAGGGARPSRRSRPGDLAHPLTGVRVVDLGVGGVGPFATSLLAWLGADVVKIEPPFDFAHTMGPYHSGHSAVYLSCNRGKRSVKLDLKRTHDLRVAQDLLAEADVLSANFRTGVLERLGLGFDEVASLNPAIVYCSATGYGWTGPLAGEACTDPHIQAFGGFASLNAAADGAPRMLRYFGGVDVMTSCVLAEGIVAALLVRDRIGGPVRMETSMLHAVAELAHAAATEQPRAPDDLFTAYDGYVAVTCRDDDEWRRLVDALGRPRQLTDTAFETSAGRAAGKDRLRAVLDGLLAGRAANGWATTLSPLGIPCVRSIADDEAIARTDYWQEHLLTEMPIGYRDDSDVIVGGGPPIALEHATRVLRAPLPGEHTSLADGQPWRDVHGTP